MAKIFRPVCLMVILALVLSLGVAIAGQARLTPTALASPDSTVIELWSEGPNGIAEWSTAQVYSGSYSVALIISGTTPGDDGAAVWIPIPSGITLDQITALKFWEYVASGYTQASTVTLSIYLDANGNGRWDGWDTVPTEDDVLYLENPTGAVTDDAWEQIDAFTFKGAPESLSGYQPLSYWQQSVNYPSGYNATVLAIDLAIGWNAASFDNVTEYVDKLTINADTYDLEPLDADFSATPTEGIAPLTVDFTDLSTGDITSWLWHFGDGEISTKQNPSHTYYNPGTYTVSLTVTERLGGADTATDYIEVFAEPARLLVRNLIIQPANALPGQQVVISADVVNQGGIRGSKDIELVINGQAEQSTRVGVDPGAAQHITFYTSKTVPGTYEVYIEGQASAFNVLLRPHVASTGTAEGLGTGAVIAIVVIGVIFLAGMVIVFIFVRRPS